MLPSLTWTQLLGKSQQKGAEISTASVSRPTSSSKSDQSPSAESDLREKLNEIRSHDFRKGDLLEGLINKFEKLQSELTEVRNDLEAERQSRLKFQNEVHNLRAKSIAADQSSFALLLLDADGDGYIFKEDLISMGQEGGIQSAKRLRQAVKDRMFNIHKSVDNMPILVKGFLNLDGLTSAFEQANMAHLAKKLPEFIKGFNQVELCEISVVGSGKDRADEKIRDYFKLFLENPTCRQIIFAACHDNGYVRMLEKVEGPEMTDKVTLVSCFKTGKEYQSLPIQQINLASLFRNTPLPKTTMRTNHTTASSTPTTQSTTSTTTTTKSTSLSSSAPSFTPSSHSTGSAALDAALRKRDTPLQPTADAMQKFRQKTAAGARFCQDYFLRGHCVKSAAACEYKHDSLKKGEILAFRDHVRRQYKCGQKKSCRDPMCYYGH